MTDENFGTKKARRCYHRVISGIKRGGRLRFLTLTSSDAAPEDIQRSWRCLYMRLKRRGLLAGYIKVTEVAEDGRKHLHILIRGPYIEQALIKQMWSQIHQSSIVDIRLAKPRRRGRQMANYMAKYMAKEGAGRYSWSWAWVWRGFVRHWTIYKRWWWATMYRPGVNGVANLILGWDWWMQGLYDFDVEAMELCIPSTGEVRRRRRARPLTKDEKAVKSRARETSEQGSLALDYGVQWTLKGEPVLVVPGPGA